MTYLEQLFDLKNKLVYLTGASGQLGREICRAFVESGSTVIAVDKVPQDHSTSSKVRTLEVDITSIGAVKSSFATVKAEFGTPDILINNAGVACFEPFEERSEEHFDWVTSVNLKGTFFCTREFAVAARAAKKGGSVVNVASFYGVVSPDFRIYSDCARHSSEVYGATKAGVIQMGRYFATHLAKDGIRVNCISPGGIFNPDLPQGADFVKNYSSRCPMARMADASEMIGGILYLSSKAAGYTTGHNLVIDGGITSW